MENANEHRLSQHRTLDPEESIAINCTEHLVAIELKSITRENYFYIVSGNVYGDNVILYYEKTYDKREPSEERIIEDGKSILINGNNSFTISTRDQGVLNLFLLAEDSFTHCHSEIIQIPIDSIPNKNPMHLWSPQISIDNEMCFLSFSMSAPAEVFFLLEERHQSNLMTRSSKEVVSLGYYGGFFAEEASLYVGSLSSSGEYSLWITMKDEDHLSDVYYYEFLIPSCYLDLSIDLLSTLPLSENEIEITFAIHSPQVPFELYIYSESRDKHAIRPSSHLVTEQGTRFDIDHDGTVIIQYQSNIVGNQLLWIVIKSSTTNCYSNLYRFVYSPSVSADNHPIYLSLPLIIPLYKTTGNSTSLVAFKMEGLIGFPEKVTKTHQPFCESYYSITEAIPIPVKDRFAISVTPFHNDFLYHFSLTADDVLSNENMLIHLAAEESITNQKHQFIHYQDFVECSLFTLSVELQKNEKNNLLLYGNVTDIAEIAWLISDHLLYEDGLELEVLSQATQNSFERHHYFVMNINQNSDYFYIVARKGNCVSKSYCIDIAKASFCS